ncbi:hypothetical protein AUP68_06007 [Ilyonectria robusta]
MPRLDLANEVQEGSGMQGCRDLHLPLPLPFLALARGHDAAPPALAPSPPCICLSPSARRSSSTPSPVRWCFELAYDGRTWNQRRGSEAQALALQAVERTCLVLDAAADAGYRGGAQPRWGLRLGSRLTSLGGFAGHHRLSYGWSVYGAPSTQLQDRLSWWHGSRHGVFLLHGTRAQMLLCAGCDGWNSGRPRSHWIDPTRDQPRMACPSPVNHEPLRLLSVRG